MRGFGCFFFFFFKEMKRLRTEIHDGSTCKSARSVRHESVSHHRAEMTRLLRCLFPLCFSPAAAPMLLLPIWIPSSSSSSSELPAPSTSPCTSPTFSSSVLQDSCPTTPPPQPTIPKSTFLRKRSIIFTKWTEMRLISAQELRNPPNANTRNKAPSGVIRCVSTLAL